RMFCMVAACPRLGRLKPNSIRPLLVARYGVVMMAVVADLPDQSKSCGDLVAPGKVGYTGRYVSRCLFHTSTASPRKSRAEARPTMSLVGRASARQSSLMLLCGNPQEGV